MSLIGSVATYRKLSAEQKAFIKNQGINASMSAHKWVRFLEPICQFDQKCDSARKTAGGFALAFAFITSFSVFISAGMQSILPFAICSTILVLFAILYFILKNRDVNNNVRTTLFPLLNVLSLELGNRQKINVNMNFRKDLKKKDVIVTPRSNASTRFYSYDVLALNCILKDGTKLAWKVRDLIRRRKKTYPRGKVKIKHKLKRRILVSLAFNPKNYSLIPGATKKAVGKIKQTDSKIVYKHTLKQSATGTVANINFSELLDSTRMPYQYLTQAN